MMVLSSRQLLSPSSPSSRPMPESLKPPKGVLEAKALQQLTQTVPTRSRLIRQLASEWLSVTTPAPRPYAELFARWITSSISSNLNTLFTGPKISSLAIVCSSFTFANTVGSTYHPRLPHRLPPETSVAPSFFPVSMYPSTLFICSSLTSGPCSVSAASEWPSLTLEEMAAMASTQRSQREEWTKVREPATQHCPALKKRLRKDWLRAVSKLAFLVMMFADLPPSSRVILFRFLSCAFRMISYPTSVDPVKATLSTPGWRTRWAPISPKPETMFTTPGGKPASLMSSAMRRAESGVCSAVFMTIVQPAARAGASFQACMRMGKFQGMTWPTTPTGSRLVERLKGPSMAMVWPRILSTQPPQQRQTRWVRVRSAIFATSTGFPLLMASMVASSLACFSTRSASLKRQRARSVGSIRAHGPRSKASRAAATAMSMSSVPPRWIVVSTVWSLGFIRSKVWLRTEFTNFPLMNSCFTNRILEISMFTKKIYLSRKKWRIYQNLKTNFLRSEEIKNCSKSPRQRLLRDYGSKISSMISCRWQSSVVILICKCIHVQVSQFTNLFLFSPHPRRKAHANPSIPLDQSDLEKDSLNNQKRRKQVPSEDLHLGDLDFDGAIVSVRAQVLDGGVEVGEELLPAEELEGVAVLQVEALPDDALDVDDLDRVVGDESEWREDYSVSFSECTCVWLCRRLLMRVSLRKKTTRRMKLGECTPFSLSFRISCCAALSRCSTFSDSLLMQYQII